MSTVSKELADTLVRNNGRVVRIVEYTNAWGKLAYGLEYPGQEGKYSPSDYVNNPRVYWEANAPLGLSGKSGT